MYLAETVMRNLNQLPSVTLPCPSSSMTPGSRELNKLPHRHIVNAVMLRFEGIWEDYFGRRRRIRSMLDLHHNFLKQR